MISKTFRWVKISSLNKFILLGFFIFFAKELLSQYNFKVEINVD